MDIVWIDYVILLVIIFSCILSLTRGFVREVLSLTTWCCAFFISHHYYSYLSCWFSDIENQIIRNGIAMAFLFIATLSIGAIVNYIISQLIEDTSLYGTDRILGIFFGALRGILVISAIIFFLDIFIGISTTNNWKKSLLIPKFSFIIKYFFDYFQDNLIFFEKK